MGRSTVHSVARIERSSSRLLIGTREEVRGGHDSMLADVVKNVGQQHVGESNAPAAAFDVSRDGNGQVSQCTGNDEPAADTHRSKSLWRTNSNCCDEAF